MNAERRESSKVSLLDVNRETAIISLGKLLQIPQESFLKEHQISMTQSLHDSLKRGETAGYISAPGASGKTAIMLMLAKTLGLKTIILSHTQQLLKQTYTKACELTPNLDIGNYFANEKDLGHRVVNVTYQSIPSILKDSKKGKQDFDPNDIGLVLCDEVDLALGEERHKIFREFPNALKFGVTASPDFDPLSGFIERDIVGKDEQWVGLFTNPIHEMTLEEAIERGIDIQSEVIVIKSDVNVANIQVSSNGEYNASDVKKYFDKEQRNVLAVAMIAGLNSIPPNINLSEKQRKELQNIHEKIAGKRVAIFTIDIEHADKLAETLRAQGITAEAVHSRMKNPLEDVLADHKLGKTQVLASVEILGRAWDSPETEVGIFLRPTRSGKSLLQNFYRILRQSPASGKQRAVAIQVLDNFQDKRSAQITIPELFDPKFVIKGTQTGKEPSRSEKVSEKDKPKVIFSGMDISTIIEEAKSKDLLSTRFKQASIKETADFFEKLLVQEVSQNPDDYLYDKLRKVESQLPERIPIEAQEKALQAIASTDSNTREFGKKAFLLLNLKTFLSVIDSFFVEGIDTPEDRDEMLLSAMAGVADKLSKIRTNLQVSMQVNRAAKDAVVEFLANKDQVSPKWIESASSRRAIISEIRDMCGNISELKENEIVSLSQRISKITGLPEAKVSQYVIALKDASILDGESDASIQASSFRELKNKFLKQIFNRVLDNLTEREKRVLELRFGLEDGKEKTLEQTGREFGVTRERIRTIQAKALRKLRHPVRMQILQQTQDIVSWEDAIDGGEGVLIYNRVINISFLFPHFVDELEEIDIREIGDFFSAPITEISEAWKTDSNKKVRVFENVAETIKVFLNNADISATVKKSLINHIAEAVAYREGKENSLPAEQVVAEELEKLQAYCRKNTPAERHFYWEDNSTEDLVDEEDKLDNY